MSEDRERAAIRDWLIDGLDQRGRGARTALARFLGISPDAISRMTTGVNSREHRDVSAVELLKMEAFFNKPAPRELRIVHDTNASDGDATHTSSQLSFSRIPYQRTRSGALPEVTLREKQQAPAENRDLGVLQVGNNKSGAIALPVECEWFMPEPFLEERLAATPSASMVVEMIGDAMSPTVNPGDRLIVDLKQNRHKSDGLYMIDDGRGECVIRYLQHIPYSTPAMTIVHSSNDQFRDFEIESERVRVFGRVCGKLTAT